MFKARITSAQTSALNTFGPQFAQLGFSGWEIDSRGAVVVGGDRVAIAALEVFARGQSKRKALPQSRRQLCRNVATHARQVLAMGPCE